MVIFSFALRLAQVVKLLLSFSIYMCYALSNYVAFDILWKGFEHKMEKNQHKICWEYALRTSIVIVTCKQNIITNN